MTEADGAVAQRTTTEPGPLDHAVNTMAVGRVLLGSVSLFAPNAIVRWFGLRPHAELAYLTRIYGGRAIALGLGYLTEPREHRGRWRLLGLFVDTSDTVTALGHYLRRDVPRSASVALGALTGAYMVIGALRVGQDRREVTGQRRTTAPEAASAENF